MNRERSLFASIVAQPDNLGDIVIRRNVLTWAIDAGIPLEIFVGDSSDSYIEAFDLPRTTTLHRSARHFEIALGRAAAGRRAHMLFAPGPQVLNDSRGRLIRSTVNAVNATAVRAGGGSIIILGRSFEGQSRWNAAQERALIRRSAFATVRDRTSEKALGMPLVFEPDVAFATPPHPHGTSADRNVLAISFRDDARLTAADLEAIIAAAHEMKLRPTFVTQVKRDGVQHSELAAAHSADVVSWTSETHSEQLDRVFAAYRSAKLVLSDRLHGLIFGMSSGALPIGLAGRASSKIRKSLDPVCHVPIIERTDSKSDVIHAMDEVASMADETSRKIDDARDVLAARRTEFVRRLSTPGRETTR